MARSLGCFNSLMIVSVCQRCLNPERSVQLIFGDTQEDKLFVILCKSIFRISVALLGKVVYYSTMNDHLSVSHLWSFLYGCNHCGKCYS